MVLLTFSACHIESYNGKDGHRSAIDFESDGQDVVCGAFCNTLFECGTLGPTQYGACLTTCGKAFANNESATRAGCGCVATDACKPQSAYECDGAPLPGTGAGAGTSTATGTGTGTGTASAVTTGYPCTVTAQCASSEDCVTGACLERCNASCECRAGESCLAGHCSVAVAPKVACKTDCECPAGSHCVGGYCAAAL